MSAVDRAVGTVSSIDRDGDAQRTFIWQFALDGNRRPLPGSDGTDSSPRWSPRGDRLAFISSRSGSTQVEVTGVDGAAPEQSVGSRRA